MAPEAKVKRAVSKLLGRYPVYSFMPVPTGYGPRSLDYLCCYKGMFFAIETKAPGKTPTALQNHTIARMRSAGAVVFVIDGVSCDGFAALEHFLCG